MEGAGPRGHFRDIGDDAQIVLWNGGIWNWLDPVTAVAGAVKAAERNPRVRPCLHVRAGALEERAANREARAAHALARRLGALDRIVFFNEQGVPFTERATWLLDAACVISTASRPPRGQLLVPDTTARLFLGRPPGGLHRAATS